MRIRIFIVLFVLALSPFALFSSTIDDSRPVVKIGIVAPFTGNLAHIGENIMTWKKHAEDVLKSKQTKYHYEILTEDDQFVTRNTILAAQRLVDLNHVSVLMTYSSQAGVAASAFAESTHTPHIAIAYDHRAVAGKYTFSYVTPVDEDVPTFLKILEKRHYKNVAMISVLSATFKPAVDALHKASAAGVFSIAYEKSYSPGERDFRLGLQMIPQNVDAVILLGLDPEMAIIGRQLRETGCNKPLVTMGGSFILTASREYFEGATDVMYSDLTEPNQMNLKWTGHPLYSTGGPSMFDEIMMVVEHCEKIYRPTAIPTGEEILASLRKDREFVGILGPVKLSDDGFYRLPLHYYKIEKGGFRVITLEDL